MRKARHMPLFEILAATLDGVFAVDLHQRIAFWNEGARRILGFEAASVLGRPCYEVLRGSDEQGCVFCEAGCEAFRESLRGKLSPTRETRVRTSFGKSTRISVTTFVLPLRYRELSLLAHVFREASASREIAPRLRQALEQAVPSVELRDFPCPLERLTAMEHEILLLLAGGATTASICSRLNIGATTVRTHIGHTLEKLGVHTRLEAVACGARHGLLRFPSA
jgi:PAS domain S-box-containing protein